MNKSFRNTCRMHMVKLDNNRKTAFTLAEVLITLGIIGVVAAMTMPTIIGKTQKTTIENRLKHFYSTINQAVAHAEVEYGDKTEWDLPAADPTGETMFAWLEKYIIPYIKVVRVDKKCYGNNPCLYFEDGSKILVSIPDLLVYYPVAKSRGNIRGKDCFSFMFIPSGVDHPLGKGKGVEPYAGIANEGGTDLTTGSYGCRSQNTACIGGELLNMNCTRMIMENGWKIPENYPIKF
ncbi:MAG: DUF6613 domain-containing protein [Candidatus Gastranaerophilaceae bacterium]